MDFVGGNKNIVHLNYRLLITFKVLQYITFLAFKVDKDRFSCQFYMNHFHVKYLDN